MRKTLLLCLLSTLFVETIRAQSIVLLPSAGVQTTISTIEGLAPGINNNRQFQTNFSASLRAYIDNKKGHGLFLGISAANHGLSVATFNIASQGTMSSLSTAPRIELGYQFLTRPVYFNSILNNGIGKNHPEFNKGLFFQFQPLAGIGYNLVSRAGGTGGSGAGNSILTDAIGGRNLSLLTGANLYIGKNGKQWFFISVMRNWNFGNYSAMGTYYSQHNGNSYQNNVHSYGSGTSYSIGVPIRLGGKKGRN